MSQFPSFSVDAEGKGAYLEETGKNIEENFAVELIVNISVVGSCFIEKCREIFRLWI